MNKNRRNKNFKRVTFFFSSAAGAAAAPPPAAAATGAAATATGAPPPAAFAIRSPRFFFAASLANKVGQKESTWTLADFNKVTILSDYLLHKEQHTISKQIHMLLNAKTHYLSPNKKRNGLDPLIQTIIIQLKLNKVDLILGTLSSKIFCLNHNCNIT